MLGLLFNILFCNIELPTFIDIIAIITSSILSIVAIAISIITLKHSTNAIVESSRANIMLYIDVSINKETYLVLKNFGNSIGKIISLTIIPPIQYSKLDTDYGFDSIPSFIGVCLAPNQTIKTWFDFEHYPDKSFNIKITYSTLGKNYTTEYPIDISYIDKLDCLTYFSMDIPDEKTALVHITNQLKRLIEKF